MYRSYNYLHETYISLGELKIAKLTFWVPFYSILTARVVELFAKVYVCCVREHLKYSITVSLTYIGDVEEGGGMKLHIVHFAVRAMLT